MIESPTRAQPGGGAASLAVSWPPAPPAPLAAAARRLGRAAGALAGGSGLRAVLEQVAADAAGALAAHRCAIYLREADGADLVGAALHEGGRDGVGVEDWHGRARIPARTPGLAALLRDDAPAELRLPPCARGARRSAVELRPSLVVPIPVGSHCGGVMVLDRATALADPDRREIVRAFAALAGAGVLIARQDAMVRGQLRVLGRRLRADRPDGALEEELLEADPARTTPADVGALLARRLGLPCTVHDPAGAGVAYDAAGAAAPASPLLHAGTRAQPEVAAALDAVDPARPAVVGPHPHLGVRVRHVVARVPGAGPGGDRLIVVDEVGRALRSEDLRLVHRAALALGAATRVQHRLAAADRRTRESVVRDAVLGSDAPASLRQRAADAGVDVDGLNVVGLILGGPAGPDAGELQAAIADAGAPCAAHVASVADGLVLIAALDATRPRRDAAAGLCAALERVVAPLRADHPGLAVMLSSVCRSAGDLPHALQECRELRAHAGDRAVVWAEDLGASRLLLGRIPPAVAERFLEQAFGAITDPDERGKLLDTLETYFDANRSVRATADRLDIHENTVRHRFRRLAHATGLDVLGATDDQLTARLVLTMHRLTPTDPVTEEQP